MVLNNSTFNIPNNMVFFNDFTLLDNQYDSIELPPSSTDYYQAPCNGWLNAAGVVTTNGFIQIDLAGITIRGGTSGNLCTLFVPIHSGQYYKFLYSEVTEWFWVKFSHTSNHAAYIKY